MIACVHEARLIVVPMYLLDKLVPFCYVTFTTLHTTFAITDQHANPSDEFQGENLFLRVTSLNILGSSDTEE